MGLAACLGHGTRMPRLRFYNRRLRHEHPDENNSSGGCPPGATGDPRLSTSRSGAFCERHGASRVGARRRTTLRSSGLQQRACLTTRWLALAPPTIVRAQGGHGERHRRLFGERWSRRQRASDTSKQLLWAGEGFLESGFFSGEGESCARGCRLGCRSLSRQGERSTTATGEDASRLAARGRGTSMPLPFAKPRCLRSCACHDLCRWLSPRARWRTTRTSLPGGGFDAASSAPLAPSCLSETGRAHAGDHCALFLRGVGPSEASSRRRFTRSGAGQFPKPGVPAGDRSPAGLCPDLDRSEHLLSQPDAPRRHPEDVERSLGRRGPAPLRREALALPLAHDGQSRAGQNRAVTHRLSAKTADMHEPEVLLITWPLANERGEPCGTRPVRRNRRLFHHPGQARGTPAQRPSGPAIDVLRSGEPPLVDTPQRPE